MIDAGYNVGIFGLEFIINTKCKEKLAKSKHWIPLNDISLNTSNTCFVIRYEFNQYIPNDILYYQISAVQ